MRAGAAGHNSAADGVACRDGPAAVGGVGLLKYKPWARYLVMIVAALGLANVPVGTIVGAYTIWVLVQDTTARLFAPEANL